MRRRARRHRARISHERWLVFYADFVTLLFAFFVVMYSTVQIDKKKMGQVSAAIQTAFHSVPAAGTAEKGITQPGVNQQETESTPPSEADTQAAKARLDALEQELRKALSVEIQRGDVALHNGPDGLTVSLREVGFFDSGSADIKPGALKSFSRMALILAGQGYHIRIEGHTDNVPIHTAHCASNWELSTARATEIVRLLITSYKLPADLLSAAGYGEFHPIAGNDTDAGRAKNRRVDVVVLRQPLAGSDAKPGP